MKSAKQKISDRLYQKIANAFLALPENQMCMVAAKAFNGSLKPANAIHHGRGRLGTLKFDTRFFIPVNSFNALWPHENINEARRLGLIALAGDWHKEPNDEETKRIRKWMEENGI